MPETTLEYRYQEAKVELARLAAEILRLSGRVYGEVKLNNGFRVRITPEHVGAILVVDGQCLYASDSDHPLLWVAACKVAEQTIEAIRTVRESALSGAEVKLGIPAPAEPAKES